jgi:hypothetical protein
MSSRRPKWKEYERYFLRHGYAIRKSGGDRIIVAPPNMSPPPNRQTVRIGHLYVTPGEELPTGHVKQIKRAFGVTPNDVLH